MSISAVCCAFGILSASSSGGKAWRKVTSLGGTALLWIGLVIRSMTCAWIVMSVPVFNDKPTSTRSVETCWHCWAPNVAIDLCSLHSGVSWSAVARRLEIKVRWEALSSKARAGTDLPFASRCSVTVAVCSRPSLCDVAVDRLDIVEFSVRVKRIHPMFGWYSFGKIKECSSALKNIRFTSTCHGCPLSTAPYISLAASSYVRSGAWPRSLAPACIMTTLLTVTFTACELVIMMIHTSARCFHSMNWARSRPL